MAFSLKLQNQVTSQEICWEACIITLSPLHLQMYFFHPAQSSFNPLLMCCIFLIHTSISCPAYFKYRKPILCSPLCLHSLFNHLLPQFPVLCWQEWNPVWSFAAIAHLLQVYICCAFKECENFNNWIFDLLLPFYHFEPVWPFSTDINMVFMPADLLLSGYFLFFFWTILCKP